MSSGRGRRGSASTRSQGPRGWPGPLARQPHRSARGCGVASGARERPQGAAAALAWGSRMRRGSASASRCSRSSSGRALGLAASQSSTPRRRSLRASRLGGRESPWARPSGTCGEPLAQRGLESGQGGAAIAPTCGASARTSSARDTAEAAGPPGRSYSAVREAEALLPKGRTQPARMRSGEAWFESV